MSIVSASSSDARRFGSATEPVLVAVLVAVLLAIALQFLAHRGQASTGDGADYVAMARDPGAFPEAPEGFRILAPWLASVLPGGPADGLLLVTDVSLAFTSCLLFLWLRRSYSTTTARWGVVLFLVSGAVTAALRNPYLVDALAYVFVAAGFLLLQRRQWAQLACVLSVGVLAKETLLFMLVPAIAVGLCSRPRAPRWSLGLLVVAPIGVYLALHGTPLVYAHRGHHSYIGDIRGVFAYERDQVGILRAPFQALLYSFGALWVVALLGWRRADATLRLATLYVVPVVGSVVIAADWPRVLGFAFPIVVALACALPLSHVRRALLAASVLLDTLVLQGLSSSAEKQVLVIAAFFLGVAAAAVWRFDPAREQRA